MLFSATSPRTGPVLSTDDGASVQYLPRTQPSCAQSICGCHDIGAAVPAHGPHTPQDTPQPTSPLHPAWCGCRYPGRRDYLHLSQLRVHHTHTDGPGRHEEEPAEDCRGARLAEMASPQSPTKASIGRGGETRPSPPRRHARAVCRRTQRPPVERTRTPPLALKQHPLARTGRRWPAPRPRQRRRRQA